LRSIGIAALGPKPRTTKPAPGHKIFPYLLRGLAIERPNQIWCADITYIPIGRGFLYLVAMQPDIRRSERPRIQLRDWSPWPHGWGPLHNLPDRKPHAVELQSLNGHSLAHTMSELRERLASATGVTSSCRHGVKSGRCLTGMNVQVNFDPDGNGYLNVWRDGVQIVNYQGAIEFAGATCYLKVRHLPRASPGNVYCEFQQLAHHDRVRHRPNDIDAADDPQRRWQAPRLPLW
jgi:hypothetical protein